jgi:class 3 adenylate cyclase
MVIKTIGDAVMASFRTNDDALKCALEAQQEFEKLIEESADGYHIQIKIGVHRGPAILVNLNGRMDYFGATVNKAARVQDTAAANELVFSDEACANCQVFDALLHTKAGVIKEEQITLKGINAPQKVFRIADGGEHVIAGETGFRHSVLKQLMLLVGRPTQ